ncbi:hypothetical protein ACGF5O_44660 [Streptomyces sp. NPDC048291]
MAEDHTERVVDVYDHGSIVLCTDDGPSYWVLVVTGAQQGRI